MQEVKIIYVDSLTDLEPDRNFIVLETTENKVYIGDGTAIPKYAWLALERTEKLKKRKRKGA